MKAVAIKGTVRTDLGTKFAKQLRRDGHVPCVVYGGDQPIHFSAPALNFRDLVYTSEVRRAEIDLNGKKINAVIQDLQLHPVTDRLMHLDMMELIDGKPATILASVKLKGSARGVRNGGRLKNALRRIKVKGLPENLPASIDLDITELRIGQSIRVGDILSDKYELLASNDAVIVSIKTARAAIEDEEETEEGAEGAEGAEATAEGAEAPAEAAAEGEPKAE